VSSSPALPPFHEGSMFTLGVEEELHLVVPGTLEPLLATDALLAHSDCEAGHVAGEICDGVIELITPVSARAGEAVTTLRELRADTTGHGVGLIGAGLHPSASFGDVRHRSGPRYDLIADSMRGVMRQTPHCGVHVHVGMPDAETAIRTCNGMRKWIPLLQALGANSPFWYGRDSGLASARSVICNSFPRSGIPRAFAGYDDFEATVHDLQLVGDCPDYSLIWWDVRPHPRLGTLEIRALDAQSSTDDLAALVALAHCLAVHEASAPAERDIGPEALRAMSFAANRDGLDGRVPFDGAMVPTRNAAVLALALVGHQAVELDCWEELMLVQRLLERGNGAVRQRQAAAAAGIPAAVRMLAAETTGQRRRTRRFRDVPVRAAAGPALSVVGGSTG
jgi:glutamate---cysteine ligase / carboxylate-amine ligase